MLVFWVTILALLSTSVGRISALGGAAPASALGNYGIVFVSRRIPGNGSVYYSATGSMPGVQPYSRFEVAAPGKLLVREANGSLRTLIDGSNPTAASLNLIDVNAPDVSYDGTRIIFAGLPAGTYSQQKVGAPGAWRIYLINSDGTGLRQVTFSDRNISLSQFGNVASNFTRYDDTDPAWLPDGRIVFSSTRWPSFGMYGAALTSNLYVVNADGSNLHRITAERNGAERPVVDPLTGRIVYSRWWRNFRLGTNNMATLVAPEGGYIMKDGICALSHQGAECQEAGGLSNLERNSWHLATVNPDGTGLQQFAGRSMSTFVGEDANHAYGGSFAADGSFFANFFPMTNGTEASGFGGIRHYQRGANGYTPVIGITTRDESVLQFANPSPPSYGVYVGNYAADPAVLPDGTLLISWAVDVAQDYGLYTINPNGTGRTLVYDNPGTTELRAKVILPRTSPPIIPDKVTQVASALPPLAQGPYDIDGTFTFKDLNVYFNAPVDTNIISAIPVGSASSIRFFIDHQRSQQRGSFETLDWPILLNEIPVNPDGSLNTLSPANVPLFEQIRTKQPGYTIPLTGRGASPDEMPGAAHVAGMNYGRTGDVATCVGCHAGHSMIPVPANPAEAVWSNLAPGATVTYSSLHSSLSNGNGAVDRKVRLRIAYNNHRRYWLSREGQSPTSQWLQLTFPVPVTVRTVRLYNIPGTESSVRVLGTTVRLYSDNASTIQIASANSGALSETGTNVPFNDVRARVVRIYFTSVSGSTAGLGEVEVIARGEADLPDSLISGNTGVPGTILSIAGGGQVTSGPNGGYTLSVPAGWNGTVTPSHACYTFVPPSRSYINLLTNQSTQDFAPTFNSVSGCARVNVSVRGNQQGAYAVPPQTGLRAEYALDDGPMQVLSNNGVPIIAALRDALLFNGQVESFAQLMGLPKEQLSDTYYFPAYNNVTLDGQLRFANVDSFPTTVTVTIGGEVRGTYNLQPNAGQRVSYALDSGPMVVQSSNGARIIAALRDAFKVNGRVESFVQLMGLPKEQLSDTYYFPAYNNVTLDGQLRFGNVGTQPTTVTVSIGGVVRGTYNLQPSAGQRVSYNLDTGPVVIQSSGGVPIIAALRDAYKVNGRVESFAQLMGLPLEALSDTYYLPAYNNVTLNGQLRFGNVGSQPTTVTVTIGGEVRGTYDLQPNASQRVNYALDSGPVEVTSSSGIPIIVALRDAFIVNSRVVSFVQLMGLPQAALSDTYYFPAYNNLTLSGQLRFGVP
jgi:hypothetical protein